MPKVEAHRLFVFAGAGLSRSAPAGLPMFGALRDELLRQLGLEDYLSVQGKAPADAGAAARQEVARGLAPEPFMLALQRAGAGIERWLTGSLDGGTPNAGHHVLAQLARDGAHIWTVNFDRLVERASPSLLVNAWPQDPSGRGLLKPHGTLGGQLVFTAQDVLAPLSGAWRDRLADDIAGSDTVVFVGYSGRDLDLQPLWDGLVGKRRVLWFDLPDADEQDRKRAVLRRADLAATLEFPPAVGSPWPNPTAAFVDWCTGHGLVSVPTALRMELHADTPVPVFPALTGDVAAARAEVLAVLGDPASARRTYMARARNGPGRAAAARRALNLTVNHGGTGTARLLGFGRALPPIGRLRQVRNGLARKRLSVLFNSGRHDEVMRLTRQLGDRPVSTLLLLRAGSERMTGSLDDAADQARMALDLAREEGHPVRTANAALQLCYALLWAGRLDEARQAHDLALLPYASLAATRWVAWAGVIDASLLVHDNDPYGALAALDLAQARFTAEALLDGLVSALTVRLTALRQAADADGYRDARTRLGMLLNGRPLGTYHARGHAFTREAIALEDAQFAEHHDGRRHRGSKLLDEVVRSRYPVHAALGHLMLADGMTDDGIEHAGRALRLAEQIHARKVAARAREILAYGTATRVEIFFP